MREMSGASEENINNPGWMDGWMDRIIMQCHAELKHATLMRYYQHYAAALQLSYFKKLNSIRV